MLNISETIRGKVRVILSITKQHFQQHGARAACQRRLSFLYENAEFHTAIRRTSVKARPLNENGDDAYGATC